ncbi:MAG: methylmalonyl-CoA carboxyltransferase [Spirochaeta sp.]|jgi:acetyl-CoA carboxylase carboxyltransferase component|nr:methylmalonyl-CoA carboxyltransferase [Spirochaeta sp.]
MRESIQHMKDLREQAHSGGGEDRIEKQHEKGKRSARERLDDLFDPHSFVEHQSYIRGRSTAFGLEDKRLPGDGVITGSGLVDGRQVFVSSQDFTVLGGSLGEQHAARIAEAQKLSIATGTPFVQINDSGGARIQEGVLSLDGYARIFRANTDASGVVPQISAILGPCAGGAVYSPGITDFIFMVDNVSNMYITGPDVIRAVTGEEISHEELGGAAAHASRSGVAHFRYKSEQDCMDGIRRLLSMLPANNTEQAPRILPDAPGWDDPDRVVPEVLDIVPEDERRGYDIRRFIGTVFDTDSFFEVHAEYATNVVVGFARLAGRVVGIFANQPAVYAAALDIDASDKGARFIRFCDAFNIPIVTLVDVPGFLPGVTQEHGGIIRHGAKILYAIAEATVPKISLILRKAYGGAFIAMSAKALGYDRVLAWPIAQIAVMGAEGAANVIFRRDIANAEDSEAKRTEKIAEFKESVMDPFVAAGYGFVDDVIDPVYSRTELVRSLEMLATKREQRAPRKHGNIPL